MTRLDGSMAVAALAVAVVAAADLAHAGETDQYYPWIVHVRDSTQILDAHVNAGFDAALAEVNASPEELACPDVARRLLAAHKASAIWYPVGAIKDWRLRARPASSTERLQALTLYRYAPLLPLAFLMPLDPTVSAAGVHFGTDKIGHLLTNGIRYWDVYEAAQAGGASADEAVARAIAFGVEQELGIMGERIGSTFSYADLEANYQGLAMLRAWCEDGELVRVDGRWRLTTPFRAERWVNPCWDESFYPNAYTGPTADGVRRALPEYCAWLRTPAVVRLRSAYRARGCDSVSVRMLDTCIAAGRLPDPAPFSIERACGLPSDRRRASD